MKHHKGIKPILSFESGIHPLRRRQGHWVEHDEGMSIATFAGKEMMILVNEDGKTYQMTYLDMAHPTAFSSIAAAKAAASDFAKAVLLRLIDYVEAGPSENEPPFLADASHTEAQSPATGAPIILFRPLRDKYSESIKEAESISSRADLAKIVSRHLRTIVSASNLNVTYLGKEFRDGWNTHLVTLIGHGPVGYTSQSIK